MYGSIIGIFSLVDSHWQLVTDSQITLFAYALELKWLYTFIEVQNLLQKNELSSTIFECSFQARRLT